MIKKQTRRVHRVQTNKRFFLLIIRVCMKTKRRHTLFSFWKIVYFFPPVSARANANSISRSDIVLREPFEMVAVGGSPTTIVSYIYIHLLTCPINLNVCVADAITRRTNYCILLMRTCCLYANAVRSPPSVTDSNSLTISMLCRGFTSGYTFLFGEFHVILRPHRKSLNSYSNVKYTKKCKVL